MAQKLNENQTKLSQISKSLNDLQLSAKKLQSSLNEKNAENQSLKLTINGLQQSSQLQNDEIATQKEQLIKTSQMLQEETEKSAKLEISIKQVEKKCQALEESGKISHKKNGSRIGRRCRASYIEPNVEISGENTTGFVDEYERIEKELSLKQDSEIAVHSKVLDFANVLKLTFPEIGAEFDVFLENKETQQKMIDENKESRKRQRSLMIEKDNLEKKILDLLLFLQADSVEDAMLAIKEKNENIQNFGNFE